MLVITDRFSFARMSAMSETLDATVRVQRIRSNELVEKISALKEQYDGIKSLIASAASAKRISKMIQTELRPFSSKNFSWSDFLRINRSSVIAYAEHDKETKQYMWYLISLSEIAPI